MSRLSPISGENNPRKKLAYQYFKSLGPTRTIADIAMAGHYGSYQTIRNWCAEGKWFEKAQKHDQQIAERLASKNSSAHEHSMQTVICALDFLIEKFVSRDKDGNVTDVNLRVDGIDDAIKIVRLKSYMMGEDPDKTAGLRDGGNYHLAMVSLIQEFRSKGYDPFTEQLEAFQKRGTPLLEKGGKAASWKPATNGSVEHGEQAMETDQPLQD